MNMHVVLNPYCCIISTENSNFSTISAKNTSCLFLGSFCRCLAFSFKNSGNPGHWNCGLAKFRMLFVNKNTATSELSQSVIIPIFILIYRTFCYKHGNFKACLKFELPPFVYVDVGIIKLSDNMGFVMTANFNSTNMYCTV